METTNQPPVQTQTEPPKKSKSMLWGVIGVLVVVIAAGAIYYFSAPTQQAEDTPPVLELQKTKLQGSVINTSGFFVFDEDDVDDYTMPAGASMKTLARGPRATEAGISLYLTEKMTIEEMIEHIEPVEDMRLLFAMYSPGEDGLNLDKECYYTWPKAGTCLLDDDFEIPAYRGFSIIPDGTCIETEEITGPCADGSGTCVDHEEHHSKCKYNAAVLKDSTDTPGSFGMTLDSDEEGWTKLTLPNATALDPYEDRIKYLWRQIGDFEFEKVENISNFSQSGNYKFIWVKWNEETSVS